MLPLRKFSLSSQEIQSIFQKKIKAIHEKPFSLICDSSTVKLKFAIALSKQIKSRTARQKAKRQVHALFFKNPDSWAKHHYVLIISPKITELTFTEIKNSFDILNQKFLVKN